MACLELVSDKATRAPPTRGAKELDLLCNALAGAFKVVEG